MTGRTYSVTFDTLTNPASRKVEVVWGLKDVAKDSLVINKRGVQAVKDIVNAGADNNFYTYDGVEIRVTTVQAQMVNGGYPEGSIGTGRWTPNGGEIDSLFLEGFKIGPTDLSGAVGNAYDHWTPGTTVIQDRQRNILIKYAATSDLGVFNAADSNVSYAARYLFNADQRKQPSTTAPIVDKSTGLPYQDYTQSVPFAAFDMETTPPRRLMLGFTENNMRYGTANGRYWPPVYDVASLFGNNTGANGPLEWFFIFDRNYYDSLGAAKTAADPSLMVNLMKQPAPVMWIGTPALIAKAGWTANDQFSITRGIANGLSDVFTFTTNAPAVTQAAMQADVDKINVFPNPYFGFNSQELNKYNRFVTFNHLPQQATIRIFNLSGVLLKTITKNDDSQFARWDLRNEAALPAAAGVYIVHIDMPAIGKQKILKLAIVPEAQFLDKY